MQTQMQKEEVLSRCQAWLSEDPFERTRKEIESLMARIDDPAVYKDLAKRFSSRIQFGTAGLRAFMGAGINCMNELVVVQTSQGVAKFLLETQGYSVKKLGVVIGHDARHNSQLFARLTAAVFISQGIPVKMFPVCVPTPFVPFAVRLLEANAGFMITASHNPKNDNGYKLYWANGCQIIPPLDVFISNKIDANLKVWPEVLPLYKKLFEEQADVPERKLLIDPLKEVETAYYNEVKKLIVGKYHQHSNPLEVTYTPMHGVGSIWAQKAIEAFGLKPMHLTPEQDVPDPDFPTVSFPNPEEGKGALALAIKTATSTGSTLILANDPDADRLAVAEKLRDSDDWYVLTGNEIAFLLTYWIWEQRSTIFSKLLNKEEKKIEAMAPDNFFVVASTVSSKILKRMAEAEGFVFMECLTGFKWIGNIAEEYLLKNKKSIFLLGYEVEIGFAPLGGGKNLLFPLDKDGLRTAAMFYEMADFIYLQYDKTLVEFLQDVLYPKYGYSFMKNKYFYTPTSQALVDAIDRLRNWEGTPGTYPLYLGKNGQKTSPSTQKIMKVMDLTYHIMVDREASDKSLLSDGSSSPLPPNADYENHERFFPKLEGTGGGQHIWLELENKVTVTLRNSGTEPKLKYYIEAQGDYGNKQILEALVEQTYKDLLGLLDPETYGFVAPKD